jgi:hypothetical protein
MNRSMLLPVLLLSACSNEPEISAPNASVEEVANQVREAAGESLVRPGKWESQVRVTAFDMPGAPPEMANAIRAMHDRAKVTTNCLTPEETRRPKEDFFASAGKNCRYHHFDMSGGKIDAMMICEGQGMAQTMTMVGTYSPDDYRMEMSVKADAPGGPQGQMTMKMQVDARHVGECDAEQG